MRVAGYDSQSQSLLAKAASGYVPDEPNLYAKLTGRELLRFVDTNEYGRVHGGAYPGENHTGAADRPFPFADTGLPAPCSVAIVDAAKGKPALEELAEKLKALKK